MNVLWPSDPAELWPDQVPTDLLELPVLAQRCGVRQVLAKAENQRALGSFKSLGGMYAGLRALSRRTGAASLTQLRAACAASSAPLRLVCASDGNHGLAVAAAAHHVGIAARVFLPAAVAEARAARIRALGAEIARVQGDYEDAVLQAEAFAARGEGLLIADTGSDPHDPVIADVLAGYGLLARELRAQCAQAPTHVYVQAGVGVLATALAEGLHDWLRAPARLVVVEPDNAACVGHGLRVGHPQRIAGDLATVAGMLSCGQAAGVALASLQRHGARAMRVDETGLSQAPAAVNAAGGPDSTPSGAAGVAGLLHAAVDPELRRAHGLNNDSVVLVVITEAALVESAETC
ncbi:pyridoxal-phosphate dependent enzyme [Lysobacter sp. CA199]|uniref:pyridoxal-phosphate dependent enzyme n=1 Tax=Lysobacter sp. CA199 TaxID=3455608 RepID=UPI003F8D68AA